MSSSRLALVAEIGNTIIRFAISDVDAMSITHFAAFRRAMFSRVEEAVAAYYRSVPHRPTMVGLAVAAPHVADRVHMAHGGWSFSAADIAQATGAGEVRITGRYEALALALPGLMPHDLETVVDGRPIVSAPRLVLGAGTGFGAAARLEDGNRARLLSSEAGQASFAATDADEFTLLERIARRSGRVSLDDVISTRGLEELHAMSADIAAGEPRPTAIEIVESAGRDDASARRTLALFSSLLARTAGDLALALGARGGVYLGGGIARSIVPALHQSPFQLGFKSHVCTEAHPEPIPVHVITASDAVLRGVAAALSEAFPMRTEAA